jgi:hypothetical protein
MTWHNAYIDLAGASKVVFIGYSLPDADYHVRTLLRRSLRPDAEIVVVLTKPDKPDEDVPLGRRASYATARYESFFGANRITFCLDGVRSFFAEMEKVGEFDALLAEIREMLGKPETGA